MPREHPNAERIRRGFEAFTHGDLSVLDELIADDVVWHQPGDNAISGEYRGKEELLRLFVRIWEETEGTMRTDVRSVWANEDYGVVLTRSSSEREGASLSDVVVHVLRLTPDGRLAERWSLVDDQAAMDAFWSGD